jgi:hypothetical protein
MHAHAMEELYPTLVAASRNIHDSPQHDRDLKILDVGKSDVLKTSCDDCLKML